MPPKRKLETLSWISILGTIFALLYLNNLLRNIVTYRQLTLGGKQEPLHDLLFCDWLRDYAPEKVVAYLTRDAIHILVGVWIFATILWWLIGTAGRGIPRTIAHVTLLEVVLLPFFGLTQILTIVPDSSAHCNQDTHQEGVQWIFTSVAFHSCGDMLWSSDLVQFLIFVKVALDLSRGHCRRCGTAVGVLLRVLAILWGLAICILIFVSKYQYSMDVLITLVLVPLVMENKRLFRVSQRCFVSKRRYFERQNYERAPETEITDMVLERDV
jgi:hypothetical protein